MKLVFEWTDSKARYLLKDTYNLKYLKKLNSFELFNLGVKEDLWGDKNPFKDEKQKKLKIN